MSSTAHTTTDQATDHALLEGSTFVWHELYVPNVQQAVDFYTNNLGFGTEKMSMGEGFDYTMLTKNGKGVCGVMSTTEGPAKDAPTHWSTYLAVDDVDASLSKCKLAGATVIVEPMDIPTVGRMCLIKDPQGAAIWI